MANDTAPSAGNKNDTVMVGCKLPTGMWLELIPKPNGPDGGNPWQPPPTGKRVFVKGANSVATEGPIRVNQRVLGYGRTAVSRQFWDEWYKANKDRTLVARGFIFMEQKEQDFLAHARECLPEKTGLEGLNPEGRDERLLKTQIPGQPETIVETDAQHLRRLQDSMERLGT
jgi:hypothetical protein